MKKIVIFACALLLSSIAVASNAPEPITTPPEGTISPYPPGGKKNKPVGDDTQQPTVVDEDAANPSN